MTRSESGVGLLARRGFVEPGRADTAITRWGLEPGDRDRVVTLFSRSADPDQAVDVVDRLADTDPGLPARLITDPAYGARVVAVVGASRALGASLVAHPDLLRQLDAADARRSAADVRTELLTSVGADPTAATPVATGPADRLRLAYRGALLRIAARDLIADDPPAVVGDIAGELADLADATLESALALARAEVGAPADGCRLSIIALGKCGSQELNYISDVDVLYVAEPTEGGDTDAALRAGTRLAAAVARICSAHTAAGSIWEVDAALRPEGKAGPLVRSLASMTAYYDRWAKTWEFQAMLKARAAAGDRELGARFCAMIDDQVWRAAERDHFVEDVRAMRRRVLDHIPAGHDGREIKLGAGGLRDVEFSVQLLQLVHGRVDERLRVVGTLPALEQLIAHGYVGREDGATLAEAYRFARALEHRIQLLSLRRTHLLPTDDHDLRTLARAMRMPDGGGASVVEQWRRSASRVQRLQQQLFYSPILAAVSRIGTAELRLTTQAARDRLQALGFDDPTAALRHVEALTKGVTRQAEIQRQLLPVLLGWLADAPNPDSGLLAFRQISEALGATPWYLRTLRDEGVMAERFAKLLASSRYVVSLLQRSPDNVELLAEDQPQEPRPPEHWRAEMIGAMKRRDDPARAIEAIRAVRQRGLLRISSADVLGLSDLDTVGRSLTELTSAAIDSALQVAMRDYDGPPIAVIALGRWGGREMSYASDADAMFVLGDGGGDDAIRNASVVITRLRDGLAAPGPVPAVTIDLGLRPEGKGGAMIKSLAAYRRYYQTWSATWELQAMIRATAAAGDPALGAELITELDRHRWPAGGLSEQQLAEIRKLKARMEAERLPRATDRTRHLKLGPGGLSDVEWTVQVLQLQHAHEHPTLRTPSTLAALDAAQQLELITPDDAGVLADAWRTAGRIRDLSMLVRGRPGDVLPSDFRELAAVAELMGYGSSGASHLEHDHRRITRRATVVVDRLFWGQG